MSEPAWLEYAVAPEWLGQPLTGRPDGAAGGDAVADTADIGNLADEALGTDGGDAINGLGVVGTAISQYRQSTADRVGYKIVEAAAAGVADFALGAVSVLGPMVRMVPGAGAIADLLTANTQPLLDKHVLKPLTGGFSIAGLLTGSIRVASAYAEDSGTGSTKAVSRLKARADMDNDSSAVAWLVGKLRGDV